MCIRVCLRAYTYLRVHVVRACAVHGSCSRCIKRRYTYAIVYISGLYNVFHVKIVVKKITCR